MIIPENNNAQNTHEQPHEDDNLQYNRYTIEIQDDGTLVVKDNNGVTTQVANIRGPRGPKGVEGVQGPYGNDGRDGDSWIPSVTEDGKSLIFVDSNGNRRGPYRIKGDPGERGAQGATGPKGQDADLWKPVVTEDGKYLFFENQKGEHTEKYLIQGIKGDTGGEGPRGPEGPSGPVFIPSVNADGELSWSNTGNLPNPTPINIKGSQGNQGENGAIFHPVIVDGYLTWTNDKGLPNPDPVKITGPQGETGDTGQRGKSAYELWLDEGNLGSKEEFLASLKGEKGDAAEVITTSYEDVTDFKCKVQEIDTNLIVDSDEPTQSPEQIIEERIQEIKDLRTEGHNPHNQEIYRVGWFKKAMWWCAGADRDLLTMCPSDHSKYVGVGTVILFTALMAWFSSFIAMRLVFGVDSEGIWNLGSLGAAIFAFFWGSMIFFLDRFITNTMYSDGKVTISKQEFFSGLPRITIAIFLGIVISAPLELKIFDQEIKDEIEEIRKEKLASDFNKETEKLDSLLKEINNSIENRRDNATLLESKISRLNELNLTISKKESRASKVRLHSVRPMKVGEDPNAYAQYVAGVNAANQANQSTNLQNENGAAQTEKSDRSTLQQEIDELSAKIDTTSLVMQRSLLSQEYDKKKQAYESESSANSLNLYSKNAGLYMNLHALHAIATKDYQSWTWCGETIDTILHAWWWYLFNSAICLIMLLFILIDISPVLYKMMLADGKYDNYLHQEKLLAQDKIRLSLSKMLRKLDDSELKRVAPFIMGDIYE